MLYGKFSKYIDTEISSILKYKDFLELENIDFDFIKVNIFLKSGLKKKTSKLINTNLGWYHFFYNDLENKFYNNNNYLHNYNRYDLWLKSMKKLFFSFYNLNLITKQLRLSRKIRKYTKNKVRYRANTQIIRERSVYGTVARLWKLIILKNTDSTNIRSEFVTNLIWDNLNDKYDDDTPINMQYIMINNIVSRKK